MCCVAGHFCVIIPLGAPQSPILERRECLSLIILNFEQTVDLYRKIRLEIKCNNGVETVKQKCARRKQGGFLLEGRQCLLHHRMSVTVMFLTTGATIIMLPE